MAKLCVSLAERSDDGELRRLAASASMPGAVALAYAREPSFFDSLVVHGASSQVVVARDEERGRIVGMGIRSVREAYVNGQTTSVGYLSGLRLEEGYRDARAFSRGFRTIRDLHGDGRARLYTTTVLESNPDAARLLRSGRLGLPLYRDCGRYVCGALSSRRHRRPRRLPSDIELRYALPRDLPALVRFWGDLGKGRQFFPRYTEGDLSSEGGALRGLRLEDIALAVDDQGIRATAAAWDQSSFRQSVVVRYAPWLAATRPAYNALARLVLYPRLPKPGEALSYRVLSVAVSADENAALLHGLIDKLIAERVPKGGFLLAGAHERDPLAPLIAKRSAMRYDARFHVVHWKEDAEAFDALDGRIPYLELGAL